MGIKRILCVLTALLMMLTVCACKDTTANRQSSTDIQPLQGETPVKLDGYEFKVIDFHGGRWTRSDEGTPFGDAWNRILDEVETLYDCKITLETVPPIELFSKIQPEIMAGDKCADLVVTTQWAYGGLIAGDLMMDLNRLDVNWENKWWNQNVRRMSTVKGKTFAVNSSFIFDTAQTWMLYYNEDIWNELKLPDPYELVNSGKWTMDKFMQYSKLALRDNDQSGKVDSKDDRWGVFGADGDYCRALFMALGGQYFTTNTESGQVQLACNNTRTFDIVEKMYTMNKQDQSFCLSNPDRQEDLFVAGGSLFYASTPGVKELKDMESDWGVMPLPKFDEAQETYLSGVDHNAAVCGVPITNTDKRETSILLEALGRHAMILEGVYWPDYEDTYWRHPKVDAEIIANHVLGHGQYDIALLMQNCDKTAFSTPMSCVFSAAFGGGGPDYSSVMEAAAPYIEQRLNEFFGYEQVADTAA